MVDFQRDFAYNRNRFGMAVQLFRQGGSFEPSRKFIRRQSHESIMRCDSRRRRLAHRSMQHCEEYRLGRSRAPDHRQCQADDTGAISRAVPRHQAADDESDRISGREHGRLGLSDIILYFSPLTISLLFVFKINCLFPPSTSF